MRTVDFTHIIEPSMPVYPGTEPPHLKAANTYEHDGFRETLLDAADTDLGFTLTME